MQLLLLGMAMAVFLHDTPPLAGYPVRLPPAAVAALVLLPKLAIGLTYWLACRGAYRRLGRPRGVGRLKRLNLFSALLPLLAIGLFGLDLGVGTLWLIRGADDARLTLPRDWVLLDEVAVMLPTLGLLAFSWWAYHPIDRRMREASVLRRADRGLPIYPVWTRGQYVLTQLRNQFALILGPLLLIMAWTETLVKLQQADAITATQQLWLTPVGAGLVFLGAPLLIRHLWDTVPLPPGAVRDKLQGMCDRHGVRVADLLLWRTFGGMINAAVMGLFGRVRYILLSDGLLDQVSEHEVEAVMAHELAHVRLRHLWWLLTTALAGAVGMSALGEAVVWATDVDWPAWAEPAAFGLGLLLWAWSFGYVSRRIERQADAFAARHLQGTFDVEAPADGVLPSEHFGPRAVQTMIDALQRVADLNHIAPQRRSWRHGSIAWRQAALRSLLGTPLRLAPVDRVVGRIKWLSLAVLLAGVAWTALGPR
jgi:Zn-dependent protease with chaperone function